MASDGFPCVLIADPDPDLAQVALARATESALAGLDPVSALETYLAGETTVAGVVQACQTPSLVSPRRVIVLHNVANLPAADIGVLVAYLDQPAPDATLIMVAGPGRISPKLMAAVKKRGLIVDSAPRQPKARTGWIAAQLAESELIFSPDAKALLVSHLGDQLGQLANVLNTLKARYPPGGRITEQELWPALGPAGSVPPWALTDSLASGSPADALRVLDQMSRPGGIAPLAIVATLHRHYLAIMTLCESDVRTDQEAADRLGRSSVYSAGKLRRQAESLGKNGAARALVLIHRAEVDLKGALAWPSNAILETLVARLAHRTPARSR
jgi:DNA polymerase-3 subunit delta